MIIEEYLFMLDNCAVYNLLKIKQELKSKIIKDNSVSLFRSLNRDLFNSIYHEWNTAIWNVSEIVENDTDYQKKGKKITNYLNELKSYFDND